jgi:hypothetical protein
LVSLKLSNLYHGALLVELPFAGPSRTHDANVRLAVQVDALRKAHGHSTILRGHDFRLRRPPTDAIAKTAANPPPRSHRVTAPKTTLSTYVPLRVHSHYTFLDSTLSPASAINLAKRHGLASVALTDTGNLHGAVEFVLAAKEAGIKPILGVGLRVNREPLLLYVASTSGYHNLCRLLSRHAERTAKEGDEAAVVAQQRLPFRAEELEGFTEGLIAVGCDSRLAERFPGSFYRLVTACDSPNDFPAIACPSVHYRTPAER